MFMEMRSYSYSDEKGLAFDLGYQYAFLQIDLCSAILSKDADDLNRLLARMEQLYNVISGGTRSFPKRIDPARPDVARDCYQDMRQAARSWLFSEQHQELVDEFYSQTTAIDPQHVKGSSYESALDEKRTTGMCYVNGSSPIDFDSLLDRWVIPISSVLCDLGNNVCHHPYYLGRSFADVEFALQMETVVDEVLRNRFRYVDENVQKLGMNVSQAGQTNAESENQTTRHEQATREEIENKRASFKISHDWLKEQWKIPKSFHPGGLDKPYLIIDPGAETATFLGIPLHDIKPYHIALLVLLCKENESNMVRLKDIGDAIGLDSVMRIQEYLSRIRKPLRDVLAAINPNPAQREEIEKWIRDIGKKRTKGSVNNRETITFRKIPASDARIV